MLVLVPLARVRLPRLPAVQPAPGRRRARLHGRRGQPGARVPARRARRSRRAGRRPGRRSRRCCCRCSCSPSRSSTRRSSPSCGCVERRPVTQGGRDHTSHRLVYYGLSETRAVALLALIAVAARRDERRVQRARPAGDHGARRAAHLRAARPVRRLPVGALGGRATRPPGRHAAAPRARRCSRGGWSRCSSTSCSSCASFLARVPPRRRRQGHGAPARHLPRRAPVVLGRRYVVFVAFGHLPPRLAVRDGARPRAIAARVGRLRARRLRDRRRDARPRRLPARRLRGRRRPLRRPRGRVALARPLRARGAARRGRRRGGACSSSARAGRAAASPASCARRRGLRRRLRGRQPAPPTPPDPRRDRARGDRRDADVLASSRADEVLVTIPDAPLSGSSRRAGVRGGGVPCRFVHQRPAATPATSTRRRE